MARLSTRDGYPDAPKEAQQRNTYGQDSSAKGETTASACAAEPSYVYIKAEADIWRC